MCSVFPQIGFKLSKYLDWRKKVEFNSNPEVK